MLELPPILTTSDAGRAGEGCREACADRDKRAATLLVAKILGKGVEEVERFPVGIDGEAFVLAVGTVVITFESDRRVAVAGDARLGEVDGVAGPDRKSTRLNSSH